MAITITVDNDRSAGATGIQPLIADETTGVQLPSGGGDDGNEVDVTLTAGALGGFATPFNTFLNSAPLALTLAQKQYAADHDGASSSSQFVLVTTTAGETISDLFFANSTGGLLAGVQVAGMTTLDGQSVYLWSNGNFGSTGDFCVATTSSTAGAGEVVAAFYLNEASNHLSAQVQMVVFEPIQHNLNGADPDDAVNFTDALRVGASGTLSFDFDQLASQSSLWVAVGNSSEGVLVTGLNPDVDNSTGKKTNDSDVIHSSQGGTDATIGLNNQLFDGVGETGVFTFVTGMDSLVGADSGVLSDYVIDDAGGQGIDYGGYIQGVTGAGVFISQDQGSPAAVKSLDINVFRTNNTTPEEGFGYVYADGAAKTGDALTDDIAVNVKTVTVTNKQGAIVAVWSTSPTGTQVASGSTVGGVQVTIAGNNIDVNNFGVEYTISWTVVDGQTMNRFQVVNEAGAWDVGRVDVQRSIPGSTPVGDQLFVEDDGPSVTLSLQNGAEVRLDESLGFNAGETEGGASGLGSITISAAALFNTTANFGTDGQNGASPNVWSLTIPAPGTDSGLDTTAGVSVLLYKVGADIVGRTTAGGADIFKVSINGSTGAVTMTQYAALKHPNAADPDEASAPLVMGAGSIAAVRTVKDGDNDPASASADLSPALKFEDDGPSVTLELKAGAEIRVDESLGQNAGENETGSLGSVTQTAAVLFNTTASFGQDGENGASPNVWSLSIPAPGTDSGLDTTAGVSVLLYKVGDDIVGRTTAGGADIFKISINASTGAVTLTQYAALKHPNAADPDESASPLNIASGAVAAVRTVKDGDNDPASASADLGPALKFEDDGPGVTLELQAGAEIRVDESLGQNAGENEVGSLGSVTQTAAVLFNTTANFGQDGQNGASPNVWSLSILAPGTDSGLDTTAGVSVLLYKVGDDIVGRTTAGGADIFKVSINASTGAVTMTQYAALKHPNAADPDEASAPLVMGAGSIAAVRTVKDGDNDPASASADLSPALKFEDDGPAVTLELKAGAEIRVDESLGQNAGENETGSLGSVTQTAAVLFNTTANFGQDGQNGTSPTLWSLSISGPGADSGVDTTAGVSVLLYKVGDDVVGRTSAGGANIFKISINATSGAVILTQYAALKHPNASDPDEAASPLAIASGVVAAVRTVTDGDNDTASASADIGPALKFEDDGPSVTLELKAGAEIRVDESIGQNAGENEVGSLGSVSATAAVLFNTTASFGQDGENGASPTLWSLTLSSPGADSGIDTTAGVNVLLYKVGDDIVGRTTAGGADIFKISINSSTGAVTLTEYASLKHPSTSDPDEATSPLSIAAGLVSAVRTVKDGDNDSASASADIGPALKFEDDGPGIGPISDGIVDFAAGSSVQKTLSGLIGVDAKTNPYTLTAYTAGLTVNGVALQAVAVGSTQVGYWGDTNKDSIFGNAGDTEYYRLVLGDQAGAGNYTFTVLVNPPPALLQFDFTDLPSGQNLLGVVAADKADLTKGGILVMPTNPDINDGEAGESNDGTMTNDSGTVNTSKGGGPVTIGNANQAFDGPSEGAFFIYVDNPDPGVVGGRDLSQTNADDADTVKFDGTIEVTSASVEIVQASGAGTAKRPGPATHITAYDLDPQTVGHLGDAGVETDSRDLVMDPTATDDQVNIIGVKIYDETGKLIEFRTNLQNGALTNNGSLNDTDDAGTGVSGEGGSDDSAVLIVFNRDGLGGAGNADDIYSATVSNLKANYTIEWVTAAVHDAAKVEWVAGSYDIGGFNLRQAQPSADQVLEFTARVTDGDGDFASDTWKVGIDGTGINDDGVVAGVSPAITLLALAKTAGIVDDSGMRLSSVSSLDSSDHVQRDYLVM